MFVLMKSTFSLKPQEHKCFSLFDDCQLLILSDIKKKTVNAESIIISKLVWDLQGLFQALVEVRPWC